MTRLIVVAILAFAVLAPAAGAASRNQIIQDCADGSLDGNYKASEMRDARNNLPADVDEYTDCRDLLSRASHKRKSSTAATPEGGAAGPAEIALTPANPAEQRALLSARNAAAAPVEVDGQTLVPGAAGFAAEAARRDLPGPVILLLALLGLAALAGVVPAIRRHVLARRKN